MDKPKNYEIRVENHLSESWTDWFDGLTIHNEPDGETVISGSFVDQAALFGMLTRVHSLNLTLISVNRIPATKRMRLE
ncbi:MAG: hypothetical protein PVJ21_04365 [Anaerolineales bacterium]|jgi:hypothetical protein